MTSLWFLARMCRIVSGQETPEWSNYLTAIFQPRNTLILLMN